MSDCVHFTVDNDIVELKREWLNRWKFFTDMLGEGIEINKIEWTYTGKKELKKWIKLNELIDEVVHRTKMKNDAKIYVYSDEIKYADVEKIVDYMQPIIDFELIFVYIYTD